MTQPPKPPPLPATEFRHEAEWFQDAMRYAWEYIHETRVSPALAHTVLNWVGTIDTPHPVPVFERGVTLSDAEFDRLEKIIARQNARTILIGRFLRSLVRDEAGHVFTDDEIIAADPRIDPRLEVLPLAQRRKALAILRTWADAIPIGKELHPTAALAEIVRRIPAARADERAFGGLQQQAVAETELRRDSELDRLLTDPEGVRHPDPITWVRQRYPKETQTKTSDLAFALWLAFERFEFQEVEQAVEEERSTAAALREQLALTRTRLGDRTLFPGQLIDAGYAKGAGLRGKIAQVVQGNLFADPESLAVLEAGAEIVVERTQLGRLEPLEVRALWGVFRLFSSGGDDGKKFHTAEQIVEARTFYQACGISLQNGRARHALFTAAEALARRELYVALNVKDPKDDRWYVEGRRTPIFNLTPLWTDHSDGRKRRDAEAEELAHRWAARSLNPDAPWDGPLPDAFRVELPPIMRRLWNNLTLSGDVLARLDDGAKAVRGETESFSGLEWRLFVEITQRTNKDGKTAPTDGVHPSFVDRDALLADYYGAAEVKRQRAKGKFRTGYLAQYEKAVAVLERAGLARRIEQDRQTRRGEIRDVFALNAEAMPQAALRPSNGTGNGRRRRAAS